MWAKRQENLQNERHFGDVLSRLRRVLDSSITARAAKPSDLPQVARFIQAVRQEFGFKLEQSVEELKSFLERQDCLLVVFESGSEIVGTFGAKPLSSSEMEFQKFYLSTPLRGKGLGSSLLSCFLGMTLRMGYTSVLLEIHSPFSAANQLYRSFGFLPLARSTHPILHPGGSWLRLVFGASHS